MDSNIKSLANANACTLQTCQSWHFKRKQKLEKVWQSRWWLGAKRLVFITSPAQYPIHNTEASFHGCVPTGKVFDMAITLNKLGYSSGSMFFPPAIRIFARSHSVLSKAESIWRQCTNECNLNRGQYIDLWYTCIYNIEYLPSVHKTIAIVSNLLRTIQYLFYTL
jgi:hypothetical protein